MANRLPSIGDFSIPSDLLTSHEWVADALIDGETGYNCTLIYPAIDSECPNCVFDLTTGRSANIYRTGGPIEFTKHTTCPWCGGIGRRTDNPTDTMKMRVYWGGMEVNAAMRQFQQLDKSIGTADGLLFIIAYMNDYPKFEKAEEIKVLNSFKKDIRCERASEVIPWGFRKNRYFACMLRRR